MKCTYPHRFLNIDITFDFSHNEKHSIQIDSVIKSTRIDLYCAIIKAEALQIYDHKRNVIKTAENYKTN